MDKPKCESCKWFCMLFGECRRNAPIANQKRDDNRVRVWPHVYHDDWCGEHEPKAEA